MRKKWLWLAAAPVLLSAAIFWARDATWKKQDEQFRVAMRWWMTDIDTVYISAQKTAHSRELSGFWSQKEFLSTLDTLHLKRAESGQSRNVPMLVIGFPSGVSTGETSGFYLNLENDRGWIDLPNQSSAEHWQDFEFTPETCRALKERIFALQQKDDTFFTPK